MRKTISLVEAACRELWSAGATTLILGLLSLAGTALLDAWFSNVPNPRGAADIAMLFAALWGGVLIAAPAREDQLFSMARPVGRLQFPCVQLAVLLLTVLAAGTLVDVLGAAFGLSRPLPSFELVLEVFYAALCGLLAGSLLRDRAPGMGLAFTIALLCRRAPLFLAMVLSGQLESKYYAPLTAGGFDTSMLVATTIALAFPLWHYWRHWSPLETHRAQLAILSRLGGSLILVTIIAWFLVPVFTRQ